MPGVMWASFREGDRSEYLSLYLLSSMGVAVSVPRQEDIGADFHCVLARIDGKRLTFKEPFLVQIKSSSAKSDIRYGGPDDKGRWKREEVDWLFSQELPLLIGIADKASSTLHLFSTSNMWFARNMGGDLGQVWLIPDSPNEQGSEIPRPSSQDKTEWPPRIGDQKLWSVPLGPPVVSITIQDLDDPRRLELFRGILSWMINLEQANITYRRLGVHFSRWPLQINTNICGPFVYGLACAGNAAPGANTSAQLRAAAPILAALAMNYKLQGDNEKLKQLKSVAGLLDPEWPETWELKNLVKDFL